MSLGNYLSQKNKKFTEFTLTPPVFVNIVALSYISIITVNVHLLNYESVFTDTSL
jgi:hypothetical protein